MDLDCVHERDARASGEYLRICDNGIFTADRLINENKLAKENLFQNSNSGYITLDIVGNFLKDDYLKLLNQNLNYFNMVINQIHSNYIFFKQKSTNNMMDYYNEKLFFMHNQIRIMRSDIKNYMSIPCEFCKTTGKKSIKKRK